MWWIILAVVVILLSMLREVKQYERGVVLTMGKFTGVRGPGWSIIVPCFSEYEKS